MKTYVKGGRSAEKLNELIQKQRDYRTDYSNRIDKYNAMIQEYNEAHANLETEVAHAIKSQFKECFDKLPGLSVGVRLSPLTVEINIMYNNGSVTHTADYINTRGFYGRCEFKWSITIALDVTSEDDFQLTANSANWSGLELTSIENMDILVNSAETIKQISNFDWESFVRIVNESHPNFDEYVTINHPAFDPKFVNPEYDKQIYELVLDKYVGKDVWMVSKFGSGYYTEDRCKDLYKILDKYHPHNYRVAVLTSRELTADRNVPKTYAALKYNDFVGNEVTYELNDIASKVFQDNTGKINVITQDELLDILKTGEYSIIGGSDR